MGQVLTNRIRMKKYLLAIATLALSATGLQAQRTMHPRVEVGVNVANLVIKSGGVNFSPESRSGFRVGAALEIGLPANLGSEQSHLYLAPGLTFRQQGARFSSGFISGLGIDLEGRENTTGSIVTNYLTVPVNVGARFEIGLGWPSR